MVLQIATYAFYACYALGFIFRNNNLEPMLSGSSQSALKSLGPSDIGGVVGAHGKATVR